MNVFGLNCGSSSIKGQLVDQKLRAAALAGHGERTAYATQFIRGKLIEHHHYIREHGQDLPEVRDWEWRGDERSHQQ